MALAMFLMATLSVPACKVSIGEGDNDWNEFVDAYRRDVDLGGYSMHFIDMGEGEPIVMVHGYGDSTYCWHENARSLLDAGFRVVLVDQPGLGRSGTPPEPYVYSIENQASAILSLLDRLEIERFDLVGSSMGGGISLLIGLNHPDRIRKIIVVDPACYRSTIHGFQRLLTVPGVRPVASALKGRWLIRHELRSVYFDKEKVDDVLVDEYCRAMNKSGFIEVLASLTQEYFSAVFLGMAARYGRMEPPVLIVWGELDTWVPLVDGERLHDRIPASQFEVIEKSGHLPHQERPEAFNPLIIEFLRSSKVAY